MSIRSMHRCVSEYLICIQYLIIKHKYITGNHMLTASEIFIELNSSTLASDFYYLMQRIL